MTNSFARSKFGLQILFIKVRVVCEGRATVSFIHCFLPQAVVQPGVSVHPLMVTPCSRGGSGGSSSWLSVPDNPRKVCGMDLCPVGDGVGGDGVSPSWTHGGCCLR